MRSLLALVLLVVLTSATAVYRVHHDAAQWPPDAAIYLRMTLEDRGMSRDDARDHADTFLRVTATDPDSRALYGADPPAYYVRQFDLFRTRPLFPASSAVLYPHFGPRALPIVAASAYVLATCVLFAILLWYAPPWLAALGAFAFATAPPVLGVAGLGLTDAPALLFWTASLGGIIAFTRRPSALALSCVVAASLLLAFTRPAIFLPVGAALGAWFALRNDPARRRAMMALVAATVGVALVFVAYTALVHGPGLTDQLRWEFDWQRATGDRAAAGGFASWYGHALARIAGEAVTYDVYKNGALLVLVLAALGIAAARRTPLVPLLIGAACASLIALAVNPVEYVRSVELPLVPVVVILATLALAVLVRAVHSRGDASVEEARGLGAP
jgi:hypothetical protein